MEFKRLSDVDVVVEPTDTANVLIEENGVIKKAPKTAVGGSSGFDFTIVYDNNTYTGAMTGDYQTIYNKLKNREFICGIIMHYSVNDVIDNENIYDLCSYRIPYAISIYNDGSYYDGLPYIEFCCDGGNMYHITSDNKVHCVSVD